MRKYILIGISSFVGAILRYLVREIQIFDYHGKIPLNTLLINVSGSLILAFILTVAFEIWEFNSDIRLGLTVGLIGAFTTFSTLCKETAVLLNSGDNLYAVSYIFMSAFLGLAATYLGIVIARGIGKRLIKTSNNEKSDVV